MKNEFAPYDVALAMKELGFDQEGFGYYIEGDDDEFLTISSIRSLADKSFPIVIAPTYSQAFRWFRDNYHLHITITSFRSKWRMGHTVVKKYETYEEAELACLRKLIEIVKEK